MGHVFHIVSQPADHYIWDMIEKASDYYAPQSMGHELNNPGGIQANIFENMFKNHPDYGERIIHPRFF